MKKLLASCQNLGTHFDHINKATELLLPKEALMDMSPLNLREDVPTRWNSPCYMMELLHKVHLPLMAALSSAEQKYCSPSAPERLTVGT